MAEYLHNFMVVGLDHNGDLQQLSLQSIADHLYDSHTPTLHSLETSTADQLNQYAHEDSLKGADIESEAPYAIMKMKFIDVNDFLAKDGKVHSGQVLYIPSKGNDFYEANKKAIQDELLTIDQTISELPPKSQRLFAGGHHFLASLLTTIGDNAETIGFGAHGVIDLSKSTLKLAKENLVRRLKSMGQIARRFNHTKNKGLKSEYKMQFKSMLNELDGEVGYFLRVAGTSDSDARIDFTSETGAKWKRCVYDTKRIGMDRGSSTQMSRMVVGTAKLAKRFAMLGKIAIAVSVGESAVEIGKVCSEHGFGKVCYATAGIETLGVGAGIVGAKVGEKLGKDLLLERLGVCNLLLDVETAGTGVVVCSIVVPVITSIGVSYAFTKTSKLTASALLSKIYPVLNLGDEDA